MAGDGDTNGDIKTHVATYSGVMALLKWSAISGFIVTMLVIWAIS